MESQCGLCSNSNVVQ